MPYHVPFNQRASQRSNDPIYIGFEPEAPPRPGFNWWGFHGMWMAFASLLTAGFTSFVPLVISLFGLRRPGKKMATVGTVVSLGGLLIAGSIVAGNVADHQARNRRHQRAVEQRQLSQDTKATATLLTDARDDLIEYRGSNEGYLPADIDGNVMVVSYIDPWGNSLRFEPQNEHGVIRSAGPDGEFKTRDDLTTSVKGKTDMAELHVPVSTK
ncbi:MAG: hypothetical protein AAFN77_00760 [Planctomycetota bacterium]